MSAKVAALLPLCGAVPVKEYRDIAMGTDAEELETGTGESPPSSGTEAEEREAEELVPETGESRAAAVSLRGTLSSGCAPITERQSRPAVSTLA